MLVLFTVHEHQIAHRDIKPDNVLFSKTSGTYMIADLGVSHFFDDNTTDVLTKTEGTPPFFAPECCVGERCLVGMCLCLDALDVRVVSPGGGFSAKAVDVWALGVTLFAFLAGRLPFYSSNMMQLFEDIQQKP